MFPVGLEKFSDIFSLEFIIFTCLFSALNAVILLFSSMKFLLAMQQSGYKAKRFFKWLVNPDTPYLSRLMLLCLLGFLFFALLNMCFAPLLGKVFASYIGFLSYFLFAFSYIKTESAVNAKVPLKKTRRLVFLCITYIILLAISTFALILLFNYLAFVFNSEVIAILRYTLLSSMPILTPYILYIAYMINQPLEGVVQKRYIKLAKQKLAKSDVIKIGITGSFGKTSVKEILKTILSQKYRVLSTPKSYNTPMGICLSVKGLDSSHDIFIAEMGARNKGDIKQLVDLVRPQYGVLTGINHQHLESFGSYENILNAKNELFLGLDENGVGFFSLDNSGSKELYDRFDKEKYGAGINGGKVCAKNLVITEHGTEFDLQISDKGSIKCHTVLLGKHNISNICLASAVAYKLGLTLSEIANGINRLVSINHRLELVPNNKNITIIDDSYNSNESGVISAMEVLDTFNGRKIVLTPGLVELGKQENLANFEFGRTLSKHVDKVIVIGKHNAEMIIQGLIDGGMDRENIYFSKTLNKGNAILNTMMKEGDVVLFENDLPDNYS